MVKRLIAVPIAVFVVLSAAFLLVAVVPSNPAATILGGLASQSAIIAFNHNLGLDKPLPVRYGDYLQGLAHGDLGHSYYGSDAVAADIRTYLPSTIELVVPAIIVALVLGVVLGGLGAYYPRRWPDWLSTIFTTVTQSIPDWVLGLLLIFIFYFILRWAPAPIGQSSITDAQLPSITGALIVDSLLAGNVGAAASAAAHLVLPVLSLGIVYTGVFSKVTRAALGREMQSAPIEFARACGLPEWRVVHYAWLAGRAPIITYIAIMLGALMGGESILETVFAWNGFGQWGLTGVLRLDLPVVQGFVLITGTFTVLVYIVLDLVVMLLDPRVRQ